MKKFQYLPAVVFAAAVLGLGFGQSWHIHELEQKNDALESQLHAALVSQASECAPVQVTCECPDYEEGWQDAEYVEGCETEEFSVEDLRHMCEELKTFGYVPGC